MFTAWTTRCCIYYILILPRCQETSTIWFTEVGFSSLDYVKIIAKKIKYIPDASPESEDHSSEELICCIPMQLLLTDESELLHPE